MDEYITVEELAKIANVHTETVRRWLKAGKIEGKKFGKSWRISKSVLKKILPDNDK